MRLLEANLLAVLVALTDKLPPLIHNIGHYYTHIYIFYNYLNYVFTKILAIRNKKRLPCISWKNYIENFKSKKPDKVIGKCD